MRARGREVYIIAAVVAVVLIVAWYFLLLSPTRAKVADLDTQIASAQTALANSQNQVARLETYKKTAPQSRAEIVRLGKMLPESEGIPSMIIELTKTAGASGVDLVGITRGTTAQGSPFGTQQVTLTVSGRYFDVEDFLYRVESYVAFQNSEFRAEGRLLAVGQLTVTGGASERHFEQLQRHTAADGHDPAQRLSVGSRPCGVGCGRCTMMGSRRSITYVAIALILGAALALAVALAHNPAPAGGAGVTSTQAAGASSAVLGDTAGASSLVNADPAKQEPQLDQFTPKDPFVPLTQSSSGGTTTVATTTTTTTSATTTTFAAHIKVNGSSYTVVKGDKVPSGTSAFSISAISSGDVTFAVIDGTLENGDSAVTVNLGEAVTVTLDGGKQYTLSVASIGSATSGNNGSGGATTSSHTIAVLSVSSSNGVALATIEVDGKTYPDKKVGMVITTSWGQVKILAINVSAQTVTVMHGDQTIVLHVGQVIIK